MKDHQVVNLVIHSFAIDTRFEIVWINEMGVFERTPVIGFAHVEDKRSIVTSFAGIEAMVNTDASDGSLIAARVRFKDFDFAMVKIGSTPPTWLSNPEWLSKSNVPKKRQQRRD